VTKEYRYWLTSASVRWGLNSNVKTIEHSYSKPTNVGCSVIQVNNCSETWKNGSYIDVLISVQISNSSDIK